jgi:hypothetical protein
VLKNIQATEFGTQEAMNEYLREHPDADRSKHWVKRPSNVVPEKKSPEEKTEKKPEQQQYKVVKTITDRKREVEKARRNAEKQYKTDMAEVTKHVSKIGSEAKPIAALAKKFKKAKTPREASKVLASSPDVKNLAEKYDLGMDTVTRIAKRFFSKDGDKDTSIDLSNELKNAAAVRFRVKKLEEMRVQGMPSEVFKYLPASIGFEADDSGSMKIVERFGNRLKTMKTKMEEQKLLLAEKGKIEVRVSKDMKGKNEKLKLEAMLVAIGMDTGIRTGSEENKVKKIDNEGNNTEEKTFGATTLLKKHFIPQSDGTMKLNFSGKKGTENVATISNPELVKHLKEHLKDKKDDQSVFVTKDGENVSGSSVNRYLSDYDLSFTDFRKLKGTREVYDTLHQDMENTYREIAEADVEEKEKAKEKVLGIILSKLETSYQKAKEKLSHDDVATTIDSYVNPMVILNFLSTGKMADSLEEAIETGGSVSFNLEALMREAKKYQKTASGDGIRKYCADGKITVTKMKEQLKEMMRSIPQEDKDIRITSISERVAERFILK